jgi:hypothetical protein
MPSVEIDDPLTLAMREATRNESPADTAARLQAEAEATKQSQLIDAQLRAERAQIKKEAGKIHKVLLVGMYFVSDTPLPPKAKAVSHKYPIKRSG